METLPKERRKIRIIVNSVARPVWNVGFFTNIGRNLAGVADAAKRKRQAYCLQKAGLPQITVSLLFVLPIPGYLVSDYLGYIAQRRSERRALNGLVSILVGQPGCWYRVRLVKQQH